MTVQSTPQQLAQSILKRRPDFQPKDWDYFRFWLSQYCG